MDRSVSRIVVRVALRVNFIGRRFLGHPRDWGGSTSIPFLTLGHESAPGELDRPDRAGCHLEAGRPLDRVGPSGDPRTPRPSPRCEPPTMRRSWPMAMTFLAALAAGSPG